jgi:CRISPR-associated endonuclease/helicase Cas3
MLVQNLREFFGVEWPKVTTSLQADVLSGLTVVADWIGSGNVLEKVECDNFQKLIPEALDRAGFVAPQIRTGLTFEDIFDFVPRDIQIRLSDAIDDSGVYVLEAPMGLGKTEAALYAAYKVLEAKRATGIYFALPTQLTSDKVYERMNKFLKQTLEEQDIHRSALLLHGTAWLRDTELGEEGLPGHSWFNSAKRGLLAPFAVGTIDQALMAVMNVKHGFVRTFGLAGKVVILDEVHSYDNYTGTILKELVAALRQLQCTVIILSATLTDKQRYSILGKQLGEDVKEKCSAYPLLTTYVKNELQELALAGVGNALVSVCLVRNDMDAVEETLKRAERGEQVLWIENTVLEAQERYCLLAARVAGMDIHCGLLHSRFMRIDRERNEKKWADIFGLAGRDIRQDRGRILIGTQVLEQSLDIDADFIVSRICPTDMLFQRIGRLWRHRENDTLRPTEAKREAWILSPCLNEAIIDVTRFGKSAKVYSPYILCRTLEVWEGLSFVAIPDDIRGVLERTYAERVETGEMVKLKGILEQERDKLHRFALIGISTGGKTLPESKASTRYAEMPSVEVLLIRRKTAENSGTGIRFTDGLEVKIPKFVDAKMRRKISAEILRHTVVVPEYLAPEFGMENLQWLSEYAYLGNREEYPFRLAIVSESGDLSETAAGRMLEKYDLSYDPCLGYRAVKKKGLCDGDQE